MSERDRDWRAFWAALLVLALGCGMVLRFVGLNWDEDHQFHPDERNITVAAAHLFGDNGWKPDFFAYNGLSLYAPRLIAEVVASLQGTLDGADTRLITVVCRALSAIAGSLALLLLADAGRRLGGLRGAAFAACFASFDAGLIQAAHFGTTESALVLVVSLLAWLSICVLRGQIALSGFALASGTALGFGLALKTTALAFAAIPALTGLLAIRSQGIGPSVAWGVLGVLVAAALFAALSPYSLIDLDSFRDTMRFENGVVSGREKVFWTLQFFGTPKGVFQLAQVGLLSGPGLAGLGIAGIVIVLLSSRRDRSARPLLPLVLFALIYAAIVFSWQAKFVRYLLPLTPVLVLAATWLAAGILAHSNARRLGAAIVTLAVVATLAWGTAFGSIYWRRDSRLVAADWLAANTARGDVIAAEEYEVAPPVPQGRSVIILPLLLPTSDDMLGTLAGIAAQADWIVVSSRRLSATLPRLPGRDYACAYYLALADGSLGFTPVAFFQRPPGWPPYVLPTRFGEETLSVFDHPRVRIYRGTAHLDAATLRARLEAEDLSLCTHLRLGADLLDMQAKTDAR